MSHSSNDFDELVGLVVDWLVKYENVDDDDITWDFVSEYMLSLVKDIEDEQE